MRTLGPSAIFSLSLLLAACGQNATKDANGESVLPTEAAEATTSVDPEADTQNALPEIDTAAIEKNKSENLAIANKFLAENGAKEGVTITASGLQYEVLQKGPDGGLSPEIKDNVQVHYTGTLIDGTEFDSSRTRGEPVKFRLGEVIPGWIEGVQLMGEGDRFRFFIPPALAYGENAIGPIAANSMLIFDVELLEVESPERNLANAEAFLAENAKKDGVQVTDSGLQYRVLSKGTEKGTQPAETSHVKVHYVGTLVDGTEFDSSVARGTPAEFPLNGVISGWTEGLQLMSEGDKFQFYIHPSLAYGENPRPGGPIGPNDALIFDVELIEVK